MLLASASQLRSAHVDHVAALGIRAPAPDEWLNNRTDEEWRGKHAGIRVPASEPHPTQCSLELSLPAPVSTRLHGPPEQEQ